jgi:hypothetical protein
MDELERIQAEQLDGYLTERLSGRQAGRPKAVPAAEVDLLEGLLALSERVQPDPTFAKELENRLTGEARRRSASRRTQPSGSSWLRGVISGRTDRGARVNTRIGVYVAGGLALVAILLVALIVWTQVSPPAQEGVAEVLSPIPSEGAPGGPTPVPTEMGAVIEPSPTPTVRVQPVPTDEGPVAAPTVVPPPRPEAPPMLPRLAAQVSTGFGGGGGGGETAPPEITFSLDTSLPQGPDQVMVYAQTPELLTVAAVREIAGRWGLGGEVYMPLWMTAVGVPDAFQRLDYIAVDEPRRLYFEGTELLHYWDRSVAPAYGGRWSPPESLPPVEEGVAIAEGFLRERDLLQMPYQVVAWGYEDSGTLSFYRVLDPGRTLVRPFAQVTISPDGRVGNVTYHPFDLQSLGEYAILSAEEAWSLVASGESGGRVWYEVEALSWSGPQRDLRAWNPPFWAREYPLGQPVDLFGPLSIVYAAQPGGSPHVVMNDLVLAGDDISALVQAYQAQVESTMDTETPIHVWGEVGDAGGYRVLQVAGWESAAGLTAIWSGTVGRQGDLGLLLTGDGLSFTLPDLPADLPDGAAVFVSGGQMGERLEWSIIQAQPAEMNPMPPGGAQSTEVLAAVEGVELVYFASSPGELAPESYADWSYRSVQPAWRFSGQTDGGIRFAVYVQAVVEARLLPASSANPAP